VRANCSKNDRIVHRRQLDVTDSQQVTGFTCSGFHPLKMCFGLLVLRA
jgi:hypothetical protein